ncbi:MAG: FecR domain-containing protein [Pseudomonadota bacterium]
MDSQDPSRHKIIADTAHQWRARLNDGCLTQSEISAFEEWLDEDLAHEAAYARASTLYEALGKLQSQDLEPRYLEPSLRERTLESLQKAAALARGWGGRLTAAGALVAASATLFLLAPNANEITEPVHTATLQDWQTYTTLLGETQQISLIDGSIVTLGASTTMQVQLSDAARTITLKQGAALFDVAHDPSRPFTVIAGGLSATALGTIFDVRRNGGIARVGVAEGRVQVRHDMIIHGQSMGRDNTKTLTAAQQIAATPSNGLLAIRPVSIDSVGSWADGRLFYDAAPLKEVLADARRYSNHDYQVAPGAEAILALEVTGTLNAQDMERWISKLPNMLPISVRHMSQYETVLDSMADALKQSP